VWAIGFGVLYGMIWYVDMVLFLPVVSSNLLHLWQHSALQKYHVPPYDVLHVQQCPGLKCDLQYEEITHVVVHDCSDNRGTGREMEMSSEMRRV
jgi:hypothetical protein